MKINKDWHLKNRMPKNPTEKQRALWHQEHSQNCKCREMTAKIKQVVEKYS